ncbi:cationic peroxidase SPC4-like [Oryza brachyantha]|uniref:Peroxidase n=1 Tax=Oryza brachyantha TaxID=4533 RepID=J3M2Y0_ORYBR|nr:cationic peroxidase SPC4-like [Oryza brachyantha]
MAAASGRSALALVSVVVVALLSPPAAAHELSVDFHAASCPQLMPIVRSSVQAALQQEIALAAGLLRIFFHDCFPQGCDASVYLRGGTSSEQGMGPNLTLQPRALQLVEDIRAKVHAACGPTVSCADISALATRDAVVLSGGPSYEPSLGQQDSLTPASGNLVGDLPGPNTASVQELLDLFGSRGLAEAADLVALSGGHTVGRARCDFFQDRAMRRDDTFSKKLAVNCSKDPNRLQNLDVITPDAFDNAYYIALTNNQGVFTSDMALVKDPKTRPIVRQFAADKAAFFTQFAKSMVKLSQVPRLDGNRGEIRRSCFRTNGQSLVDATATDDAQGFAASA